MSSVTLDLAALERQETPTITNTPSGIKQAKDCLTKHQLASGTELIILLLKTELLIEMSFPLAESQNS